MILSVFCLLIGPGWFLPQQTGRGQSSSEAAWTASCIHLYVSVAQMQFEVFVHYNKNNLDILSKNRTFFESPCFISENLLKCVQSMNESSGTCAPGEVHNYLRRTIPMKMISRRSFMAVAGAATAAVALTACGGSKSGSTSTAASSAAAGDAAAAASDPKVTLVYAEVNPLDTIVGQTATHFKEKVEELTGGSVVIDVQASGVLGSENDVLDAILGGSTSIDMSRISAFALTSYGCNKSKLLSIPFTFENRAHFWNFANSELAPEFLNEPQELGLPVRGIFYGEEGFRHFFTVKPVSGIADFKGLKLRVSNDPVMNGMVEGLGANPTVVSFGELYSALQTGVVDGAEQPIANYKSNAFPEVANNLILDGHTLGAVQAVITDNAWNKLTENQQAAVMEAAADTQAFNADLSETAENKVLDELKSSGCNVVDVPDKTPWQEACAKVISENTSDQAELYQQLLDMKA